MYWGKFGVIERATQLVLSLVRGDGWRMPEFSLDHLDETEFEHFCFDLLTAMGFTNLSWRKGTGLTSSPSDRGRDIQGQCIHVDVDGSTTLEDWFFECKHYRKGVPPNKLEGALAWASAERPAKLVIIASNFLSNPAKDYIDRYKATNQPGYEIRRWERPDLERLSAGRIALRRKYKVGDDFPFLEIMHPAHLMYIRDLQTNSLRYLFERLDACDPAQRDHFLGWVYLFVLQPSREEMKAYSATTRYEAFKQRCHDLASTGVTDQLMMTSYIVSCALQSTFGYGDTTAIEDKVAKSRGHIESMPLLKGRLGQRGMSEADIQNFTAFLEQMTDKLPDRIRHGYDNYVYLCENVVQPLLEERYLEGVIAAQSLIQDKSRQSSAD